MASVTPAVNTTATIDAPNDTTISWEYDRVRNAVDDLGWDPDGNEPIEFEGVDDGTLIVVPPGTYAYDGTSWVAGSAEQVGLRGLGDSREDVVFRSEPGTAGEYLLNIGGGRCHEVSNFTIDWTDRRDTAGVAFRLLQEDDLVIRDVEWVGYTPPGDKPDTGSTAIPDDAARVDTFKAFTQITAEDGVGLIERMDMTGPSHIDGHKGGDGICIHNDRHAGTIVYSDCEWANVNGDAPIYSSGYGRVIANRVSTTNCAMAGLRMGGTSVCRDCSVLIDHDNQHPDNTGAFTAANGIMYAGQAGKHHGGRIEGCEVEVRSNQTVGQALRFSSTGLDVSVTDTSLRVRDTAAVYALGPEEGYDATFDPQPPYRLTFDGVTVEHSGGLERFDGVVELHGRPESAVDVDLSSPDADVGVALQDSPRSHITGAIDVPGEQVAHENSPNCTVALTDGGTNGGSAPLPDDSPDTDGGSSERRRFTVHGTGDYARYVVEVSGGLWSGESGEEDPNGATRQVGHIAGNGTDPYEFTGEVTAFTVETGDCDIKFEGETVTPSELVERTASSGGDSGNGSGSESGDSSDGSGSGGDGSSGDDSTDDGSGESPSPTPAPAPSTDDVVLSDFGAAPNATPGENAAAIAEALTTASRIYVPNGVYTCNAVDLEDIGDVELHGPGALRAADSIGEYQFLLRLRGGRSITIDGPRFDGVEANDTARGAVRIENATEVRFRNCEVFDWQDRDGVTDQPHAVNIVGCRGVWVTDNHVHHVGAKGINVYAESGGQPVDEVVIRGNDIHDTGEEAIFAGSEVNTAENPARFVVEGNHLRDNRSQYLVRVAGDGGENHTVIANNTALNAATAAYNYKTPNVSASHAVITGNSYRGGGRAGISVQSTGDGELSALITGNHITGDNGGIIFESGCVSSLEANNITPDVQIGANDEVVQPDAGVPREEFDTLVERVDGMQSKARTIREKIAALLKR